MAAAAAPQSMTADACRWWQGHHSLPSALAATPWEQLLLPAVDSLPGRVHASIPQDQGSRWLGGLLLSGSKAPAPAWAAKPTCWRVKRTARCAAGRAAPAAARLAASTASSAEANSGKLSCAAGPAAGRGVWRLRAAQDSGVTTT